MRALRPMTQEEQEFAEQRHDLVIAFLCRKHLPMNDFYDIIIFGYLSAVQQYFRAPPIGVTFEAMAVQAMKDSILRNREYHARAKRSGVTVSLDDAARSLTDPRRDTQRKVEGKALLEQVLSIATPNEAKVIHLLMDGFVLHEAARLLKMPKTTAVNYMENFCCRVKASIG